MKPMHQALIDLFTAALETGADVVVYEHRTAGARGVLVAWAAELQLAVVERDCGSRNRTASVDMPSGTQITVISRKTAHAVEACQ